MAIIPCMLAEVITQWFDRRLGNWILLCVKGQEVCYVENSNAFKSLQAQKVLVTGHDKLRRSSDSALQNSIVAGVVREWPLLFESV
jgi:hypothetical protein